ncbi:MAG TPA: DUF1924 domain-containing protein [Rhodocyclaceae bacterium]|nr:DUF1924 domain-containing protein [Rhodocyclaceae bacterium]
MERLFPLLLLVACGLAGAETPRQIADRYAIGGSAQRGAEFYGRKFGISEKMPSCAACHTDKPAQPGQHVVTHKDIKPLAPSANAERFTDPAKVEKWFRRNCKEVVGRECSAGEKADFIAFVMEAL